jgi:hypothetical protein
LFCRCARRGRVRYIQDGGENEMKKLKYVVVGGVGGAVVLIMLDICLSAMIHSFTGATKPFKPMPLDWFVREAFLGAVLGAVTYPSIILAQAGSNRSAGKLCIFGGVLMALLMITQIGFVVYYTYKFISSGGTVSSVGPTQIPVQTRIVLSSLMLNVPFQWSLLLMAGGIWLLKRKQPIS